MGFQVKGAAREHLECIAAAGNGRYYDAPDADSLARQLQRASQLSVDGYRFRGERVTGTATGAGAPVLAPGQYLDTIGPGEQRYYAVDLDAASMADSPRRRCRSPGRPSTVPAGCGQQVRYDVEFANEPTVERGGSTTC
ncbi:hypothetical protein [Streptomyces sp. NPDC056255]|uniref:hypothetical protein n=1 Tax=Streptomyces sp. NPDC056255 TaxID=3345764 RepID=UPI0035D66CDB